MRIAICEDCEQQRQHYSQLIKRISSSLHIKTDIFSYKSGDQLLFDIEDIEPYDLLFLDIHMDGTDGYTVAEILKKRNYRCEIIFLTNDKDKVWKAFDVEALHYLVKTMISEERFAQVFEWAVKKVLAKKNQYILLSCAGEMRKILISSIEYFEVIRNVIIVHYDKDQTFEFYSTLGKIENILMGKDFVRTHRSFLVSLSSIQSIQTTEIILLNGKKVPLSRKKYAEIKEKFNLYHAP